MADIENRMFTRVSILTIACLGLAACAPLSAQVLYGTLLGNVTGPDGQAVPNVKLKLQSPDTGFSTETTADGRGDYAFRDLRPGVYQVTAAAAGFRPAEVDSINVNANVATRADIRLALAAVNQTVEVTANASDLQTESGDLHTEINSTEIEDLPINGYRNYQSLLNQVPGATPVQYQNSIMDTPSRSLATNFNGSSRNTWATAVDGAAIQQVYLPHHTLYNPPTDAIESVNITTNSFNAEQGLAGGAVVTVITKSGTNNFHGTAYEDHTNSDLAARNFFYLGSTVPKQLLNQFGATLGGPIRKNKLFFFTSFEGLLQRQNDSNIITLPTAAERSGNFPGFSTIYNPATGNPDGTGRSPYPGNIIPSSAFSPAAQKMLSLVPLANLPGAANNYFADANFSLNRYSYDEKVTWQIDDKSSLFGKFSYMNAKADALGTLGAGGGTGLSPGGSNSGSGVSNTNVYVAGMGYTHTFTPSLLLDANFGFGRNDLHWVENDYGTNYGTGFLGIPGTNGSNPLQSGLPSFAVSGFETFGNTDAYTPEIKHDDVFTYAVNLGWVKGAHTARFGLQMLNNRLDEFQPQRGFGPRGGFTFTGGSTALNGGSSPSSANAFADFLLGDAATLGKSYQYNDPILETEWQFGLYAQDQWRITPKLTLTYGIRWEYYPILSPIDRYDIATNNVYLGGAGGVPTNAGTTANPHQFAPRAGLAYTLNPKTVLRAGYGISIDPYPFSRAMRDPYPVTIAQTITSTSTYTPAGTLAAGIPPIAPVNPVNGVAPLPLSAYTKTLNPGQFNRGYIESFNASIERVLGAGFTLTASYVGTRSIHQMAFEEANAGQIPGAGALGQPEYPTFGRTSETQIILPYNTANYNALQTNVRRALRGGLLFTASYTWSKSIDFSTDSDGTPLFNIAADESRNRAVSNFDRTHVFQSAVVWDVPFGRGHHLLNSGLAAQIAGGWQINAIASAYTGLPFTVTASATSLNAPFNTQVADQVKLNVTILGGIGANAAWFDPTAFAPVSQARFGNARRNSMRGPGDGNLDFNVARSFSLREWLKFSLRAEAFNLTNTPNFANPSGNASSGTLGHVTSTVGGEADSRVIRFSGKFTF